VASSGACLNLATGGLTLAASGVVSSAGVPLFDVSFTATFPYEIEDVAPPSGATCAAPPLLDFDGKATRCINPDGERQSSLGSSSGKSRRLRTRRD
jgi:hypothetical protein